MPTTLALNGITKRFGRVTALDDAQLVVHGGTVHTLLGENGAGKTTLMRIAYGMIRPDGGTVTVDGADRRFASSADAIRAGIGMVHQHFALVQAMTVAENVALGGRGRYDARSNADGVRRIGEETGLAVDPAAIVEDLSVEAQQRVEIIKALVRQARVLILDEPTAVLAPAAATALLRWLRRFADSGGTVVLITHRLREALSIADAVTVLRHGRTVLTADVATITEADLAGAMLGQAVGNAVAPSTAAPVPATWPPTLRALRPDVEQQVHMGETPPRTRRPVGPDIVVVSAVTVRDGRGVTKVTDASFEIRGGEIVGVAAVEGAGQHELLRAIAGRHPVAAGRITTPPSVGFIPEDRQRDGLVLDFPLYENVALRGAGARRGRVVWGAVRAATRRLLSEYDVRADSDAIGAATLSGGNQQKLILARELEPQLQLGPAGGRAGAADTDPLRLPANADPPVTVTASTAASCLVAENPTRGLDVQATAVVHQRLRAARDRGMAIILHASDLDEALELADRILVIAHGIVRDVPRDRETVGRAMLGLATMG